MDQSLVVLGYVQVLQTEGKLIQYHSQAADITEETFSGSAFPRGNIIIVVRNVNTRKSLSKTSNDINNHVRSVQVVDYEFIQDYSGNVELSMVKTITIQ